MSIKSFTTKLAALLGILPFALPSHAQISDRFHFSGFASFVAQQSLDKDELYGDATARVPSSIEMRDYSKLGLRVKVDLHDKLTFTTQMIADGSNNFEPEFDWIFLSYNFTPDLVLHVGKYVTNYFMYSDYADISYAYPWVEAPNAVYGTNINKTLEGAKLVWDSRLGGGWTSELSFSIGKDRVKLDKVGVKNATMELNRALGLSWQVDRDWLSLRASYYHTRSNANLNNTQLDLRAILQSVGANANLLNYASLEKKTAWKDSNSFFASLGASLNFEHVFAIAEITRSEMEDTIAVGEQTAGYLTVGTYLPRDFSIAVTAYQKSNSANKEIQDAIAEATNFAVANAGSDLALIGSTYAAAGVLNAALLETQKRERKGLTLTGRWNFHSNASAKIEYTYEHQTYYPRGNKTKITPDAIRLGLDLVF